MLWKATTTLVSCGTSGFNWEWDQFPYSCSQRTKSPNSIPAFPQVSHKDKGARLNPNSFNQPHMHETKGIFLLHSQKRRVWLAFWFCSISLWERGLLQSLLAYGACYWQHFRLTLAENKSIPLSNIMRFPYLLFPLSVPHPEHICGWHRVSIVTPYEYAQMQRFFFFFFLGCHGWLKQELG